MISDYLTSNCLAKRWSLSPYTIRFWRISGKGPNYLKLNGRVLYRPEDIELFEKDKLRQHTSEPKKKN
ncbi:MAG: hypothetical protein BGO67_10565 [Alphaproteobacteria bacterium 41-28]|nr:MAG: hypothetical protein BGO67_10565 [Alphaproteobacteria bacterium 41-28]